MYSSALPLDNAANDGRFWRWLAAFAILGNICLNGYANVRPFNGQTMGEVSGKYPTLLTPAAYTFTIWGLIFFALTAYAVWQLLPAQRRHPLPDAVAKPLALASLATAAWVVVFAYELIYPSIAVMLGILGALVLAYGRARTLVQKGKAPHWVSIPFALYLAWVSVAAVINIAIGLQKIGFPNPPSVIYLALLVVMAVGLLMAWTFKERTFPLVVAWALAGVWLARMGENPDLAWLALGSAVLVAVLGLVLAQQGRQLQPWQVATAAAAALEAEMAAKSRMKVHG